MALSNDEIQELLAPKSSVTKLEPRPHTKHPAFLNVGRITYSDKMEPCLNAGYWKVVENEAVFAKSNGCHSPTHYKLDGVFYCVNHLLSKLNLEFEEVKS